MADRNVIAIVTPAFGSPESVEQLKKEAGAGNGSQAAIRLVAPAVEIDPLHHTLGDIDEPRVRAKERLDEALAAAQAGGVQIAGAEVGDPDPVQAAQDALLKEPADEVLIFSHADDSKDWYEGGLWENAEDSLKPWLRLVVVEGGPDDNEHVVETDTSSPGYSNTDAGHEVNSAYLPGLTRADLGGMIAGVVGTIVAIILAAIATSGSTGEGWAGLAIGIAIFIALINMAHVVGLLLMESVRYRGGFAKLFRTLSMVGTPAAVVINAIIAIFLT